MRTTLRVASFGALSVALTLGSALAITSPAAAASTNVDWSCDADGNRVSIGTTIDGSAPSHLLPGDQYEVVLTPAPQTIPPTAAGRTLNDLHKLTLRVPVPAGASVLGVSLSGGSNLGGGTPTVSQSGGVVRMDVPGPLAGGSTIQLPAMHLQLQATAGPGSTINTVVGGSSFSDPGLSFSASLHISPGIDVNRSATCFVSPNPTLTSTTVDNSTPIVLSANSPALGTFGNRTVSVVNSTEGRLLYTWWDLGGGSVGWREIPGGSIASDSAPAVAVTDNGNYVFVAVRDKTGMLYLNQGVPGGSWVGWQSMGVSSKYAPVLAGQGRRTVATIVTDDGRVLYTWWDLGGGGNGWREVPGDTRVTSSVAASLVDGGKYLFLSARSANGLLTGNQGNVGGTWVGWRSTDLAINTAPAMSTSGNRTLLAVVRTDGTLGTDWWDLGGGGHGLTTIPDGSTPSTPGVSLVDNGRYAFVMIRNVFNLLSVNQGDPTTGNWIGWR